VAAPNGTINAEAAGAAATPTGRAATNGTVAPTTYLIGEPNDAAALAAGQAHEAATRAGAIRAAALTAGEARKAASRAAATADSRRRHPPTPAAATTATENAQPPPVAAPNGTINAEAAGAAATPTGRAATNGTAAPANQRADGSAEEDAGTMPVTAAAATAMDDDHGAAEDGSEKKAVVGSAEAGANDMALAVVGGEEAEETDSGGWASGERSTRRRTSSGMVSTATANARPGRGTPVAAEAGNEGAATWAAGLSDGGAETVADADVSPTSKPEYKRPPRKRGGKKTGLTQGQRQHLQNKERRDANG